MTDMTVWHSMELAMDQRGSEQTTSASYTHNTRKQTIKFSFHHERMRPNTKRGTVPNSQIELLDAAPWDLRLTKQLAALRAWYFADSYTRASSRKQELRLVLRGGHHRAEAFLSLMRAHHHANIYSWEKSELWRSRGDREARTPLSCIADGVYVTILFLGNASHNEVCKICDELNVGNDAVGAIGFVDVLHGACVMRYAKRGQYHTFVYHAFKIQYVV